MNPFVKKPGPKALVASMLVMLLSACFFAGITVAQPPETDEAPPPAKKTKAQPPARKLEKKTLETKDGVQLYVEYFPGAPPENGSSKLAAIADRVPP
jgi:hypothetical protein